MPSKQEIIVKMEKEKKLDKALLMALLYSFSIAFASEEEEVRGLYMYNYTCNY